MPKGQWQPPEAGNAPAEVRHILKVAYAAYRDKHGGENPRTKAAGAKRAWGAVKRAGWKKNPKTGRWVRKATAKSMADVIASLWHKEFGGEGSGNFGHAGRPGEVGGSQSEGGGSADRWKSVDKEIERLEVKMLELEADLRNAEERTGGDTVAARKAIAEREDLRDEVRRTERDLQKMIRYREYGITDKDVLQWVSTQSGASAIQKQMAEDVQANRDSDWVEAVRSGEDGKNLYRGLGYKPDDPNHPKNWEVGSEQQIMPASFSKSLTVAEGFAFRGEEYPDPVVFYASSREGKLKGLDISKHPKAYGEELEVITGGRFLVSRKMDVMRKGKRILVVEIEQVGIF